MDASPQALDVDALVLAAFRQHLDSDRVGPDDDFFTCGGDSIEASEIVNALSLHLGVQIPADVLFRCATARQLAAHLRAEHDHAGVSPDASVVTLNQARGGHPVFLVPALYPSPWVFLPLVESMGLSRPVYGLRSPELDWPADVLSPGELVAHYVTAIRRVQPRGPYTLIGYSFGGRLAIEIATRLAVDAVVRDVVLLDTAGPPGLVERWRRALAEGELLQDLLIHLSRRNWIGTRTLTRLGITSPLSRASMPFGPGPLAREEVRLALRLIDPGRAVSDDLGLGALCASLVSTLKAVASPMEWAAAEQFLPLYDRDPLLAIKAYKVVVKNTLISRRHRVRAVFPGSLTIFAAEESQDVVRWQRHSTGPIRIHWVPARSLRGERVHLSFLDSRNVTLYARTLAGLLDGASAPERQIA